MPSSSDNPLTIPVKPFLYQPRPAALTLRRLLAAQAAGLLAALTGWPLIFIISISLPLTMQQRGELPAWFVPAYGALQFLAYGVALGLAQLMVLDHWVQGKQGWVAASGLSGLLLFAAAALLSARWSFGPPEAAFALPLAALAGGLGGLALGAAQSPFVKTRRRLWTLVTALTWAAAAPLAVLLIGRAAALFGM